MIDPQLLKLLICPKCRAELASKSGAPYCGNCRQRYLDVGGVPWVFSYPEATLADWRNKAQFQLQTMRHELAEVQQIQVSNPISHQRLSLLATGYKHNIQELERLLKPLNLAAKAGRDLLYAVKSELPLTQRLMGYYANLHRDWCWGDLEHQATNQLIRDLGCEPKGSVLVLGAGAGRLAYDLAQLERVERVVALDINPLLVLFGKAMTDGESLTYFEFPVAPKSLAATSVQSLCRAPNGPAKKLMWLFADGMNPPFKAQSFDMVITPWFIDVIPQGLDSLSARINRLLKTGGHWLNFGPFGFLGASFANQWSAEEVLSMVPTAGFQISKSETRELPYLQSPHSSQRRLETLLAFVAQKSEDVVEPAPFKNYPEWMTDWSRPIGLSEKYSRYRMASELQIEVLSQIDGRRTVEDLAKTLAERHGLSPDEAQGAVSTLLRQIWDGA